jgi:tetratricopeptide (TPR) repeat protein
LVEVQGGAISVHRLVQAVVRDRLDEEGRKTWAEAAVRVVNAAFPYRLNEIKTWSPSSRLLPHALAAAERAEELRVSLKTCSRLLNQVGLYLQMRAELPAAKSVLGRALRVSVAVHGPDHSAVATAANNLGNVLRGEGDFSGARACFERALTIDEATYGPDHPTVAIYVNSLGSLLEDRGDLAGARAHLERALKISEGSLRALSPDGCYPGKQSRKRAPEAGRFGWSAGLL